MKTLQDVRLTGIEFLFYNKFTSVKSPLASCQLKEIKSGRKISSFNDCFFSPKNFLFYFFAETVINSKHKLLFRKWKAEKSR